MEVTIVGNGIRLDGETVGRIDDTSRGRGAILADALQGLVVEELWGGGFLPDPEGPTSADVDDAAERGYEDGRDQGLDDGRDEALSEIRSLIESGGSDAEILNLIRDEVGLCRA